MVALQQAIDQAFEVFTHFAQGGHIEGNDVQTVEQVLAELAGFDERGKVFVGGGNDAHVHLHFLRIADAAHGFFLNGTQEFDLHRQRQVGHFVEKERAAVGVLEEA